MFDNARYVSRGAMTRLGLETQALMWHMIDETEVVSKDYLQVFTLSVSGDGQKISHTQERPFYRNEIHYPHRNPICEKVYVIDDGDHSTMLLANEY